MLPVDYKLILYNETGRQLDFSGNSANEAADVRVKRKTIGGSDGLYDENSSEDNYSASTDLANGSTEVLGTVSGNTYPLADVEMTAKTDNASADGDLSLLLVRSADDGTTWPSDAGNWDPDTEADVVLVLNFGGAEEHSDSAGL